MSQDFHQPSSTVFRASFFCLRISRICWFSKRCLWPDDRGGGWWGLARSIRLGGLLGFIYACWSCWDNHMVILLFLCPSTLNITERRAHARTRQPTTQADNIKSSPAHELISRGGLFFCVLTLNLVRFRTGTHLEMLRILSNSRLSLPVLSHLSSSNKAGCNPVVQDANPDSFVVCHFTSRDDHPDSKLPLRDDASTVRVGLFELHPICFVTTS